MAKNIIVTTKTNAKNKNNIKTKIDKTKAYK